MFNYLSSLAGLCQGIAGVISDGEKVQYECPANLKAVLQEASHALDTQAVRVHYSPSSNKPEIVNARGAYRQLTIRERIAIKLLGGRTAVRV